MKIIGAIFISIGLALLVFIVYLLWNEGNKVRSPLPEENGVKVIIVTPTAK